MVEGTAELVVGEALPSAVLPQKMELSELGTMGQIVSTRPEVVTVHGG